MTQGLAQFQSLAMNLGMNMAENDQDFNIPDVVKSRLIANKVINQSWLAQNGQSTNLNELWDINKIPFYIFNKSTIDSLYINEKAVNKFKDHIEVSEDRLSGLITITAIMEDPLISANIANYIGSQVQLYIQKENSAQSTKEKIFHNFGMTRPEGYRKALRLMKMAEKFSLPVISFIDTPGAYPGIGAE